MKTYKITSIVGTDNVLRDGAGYKAVLTDFLAERYNVSKSRGVILREHPTYFEAVNFNPNPGFSFEVTGENERTKYFSFMLGEEPGTTPYRKKNS
ncbi:MAG: hypothetical protein IJ593_09380 [Lachnospiraceae bacterium]|nr:hypothetical protein [Lachnospiraceae bacterium]